ncbi:aspartyl protease family protein [Sandarakinorhabdus sp.]|uniref:aspartyl protease family protein n=1 Tax=Sandarakinorhabdus sp. TaxID=1916663 RepID=UPI00333F12C4
MSNPFNLQVLDGLFDTGAQTTCITPRAASKIGLSPLGVLPIQGVGGVNLHNYYLFRIGFVDMQANEFGGTNPHIHFVEKDIEGPEFDCGPNAGFDILIGMDLISAGTLTIGRNGRFKFSF